MKLSNLLFIFNIFVIWLVTTGIVLAFSIQKIDNIIKKEMIDSEIWSATCPVPINRMRLLTFSYYDFHGKVQNGELIILDAAAKHVLEVMKGLYDIKFPLETVKREESYNYKKDGKYILKLPLYNNSSSFNCRPIKDTNIFSLHAYGLAIDINPKQNPYVIIPDPDSEEIKNKNPQEPQVVYVEPAAGVYYLNRSNKKPGMIIPGDKIIQLFYDNGFITWGGTWNFPLDTQHFQTTREIANLLVQMHSEDAEYFFNIYVKSKTLKTNSPNVKNIIIHIADFYKQNPKKLMSYLKNNEENFINNPNSVMQNYQ